MRASKPTVGRSARGDSRFACSREIVGTFALASARKTRPIPSRDVIAPPVTKRLLDALWTRRMANTGRITEESHTEHKPLASRRWWSKGACIPRWVSFYHSSTAFPLEITHPCTTLAKDASQSGLRRTNACIAELRTLHTGHTPT